MNTIPNIKRDLRHPNRVYPQTGHIHRRSLGTQYFSESAFSCRISPLQGRQSDGSVFGHGGVVNTASGEWLCPLLGPTNAAHRLPIFVIDLLEVFGNEIHI